MNAAANNRTPGDLASQIGIKGEQVAQTIQLIIESIQTQPEAVVLMLVQDNIQQMCDLAEQLELQVTS